MHTQRPFLQCLGCVACLLALVACHGGGDDPDAYLRPYRLTGTVWQDSLHYDTPLRLYTVNHKHLTCDTLTVTRGRFACQGATTDLDELYLYDSNGVSHHLWAMGGQDLEIEIDSTSHLLLLCTDSLNSWLADATALLDTLTDTARQAAVDSLCKANSHSIRAALLLEEQLPLLPDSIGARRTLGNIDREVMPRWLGERLEQMFDRRTTVARTGDVAPPCRIATQDTLIDLLENHPNGFLIAFWADYDSASVDSLQQLQSIVKAYPNKRLEVLTVCLSAPDSATWRTRVSGLPGHHAWMAAGLSDPRMRAWKVQRVPHAMVINQYGNIYALGWGADLRHAIGRLPDKGKTSPAAQKADKPRNHSLPIQKKKR